MITELPDNPNYFSGYQLTDVVHLRLRLGFHQLPGRFSKVRKLLFWSLSNISKMIAIII